MSTSTIAQKVGDMRANVAAQPRSEISDVFEREQSTLALLSEPDGALPVGSTLPDVELIGPNGASTTLGEAMGGRPAVVVFYRGAWCPYCNIALRNYRDFLLPALSDRAVRLIAVSPQGPDGSLTMQERHDLAFAVLSDPGNVLARVMGIVRRPRPRCARRNSGWDWTSRSSTRMVRPRCLADHRHPRRWSDSALDRCPS